MYKSVSRKGSRPTGSDAAVVIHEGAAFWSDGWKPGWKRLGRGQSKNDSNGNNAFKMLPRGLPWLRSG